jgi:hypothetical protein
MPCYFEKLRFRAGLRKLCCLVALSLRCSPALFAKPLGPRELGSALAVDGGSEGIADSSEDRDLPSYEPGQLTKTAGGIILPDPSSMAVVLPGVAKAPVTSQKWNWKATTLQTFEFTMFSHLWRTGFDPSLRYQLNHKPFFHDWFASYGGYNLHRWGDGDDFIVNYVGHPLQGAVTNRLYMQNDPRSFVSIGKNRNYWVPLGWGTLWAAIWQVQWKVGPLSETSFGAAGGWGYVPGCGTDLACLKNPKYPKPPTNNTGLTDWVSTPLIGALWVIGEDTLDRYVVAPIARNHPILGGRLLRAILEPSRDFAALFAGKLVWELPQPENNYVVKTLPNPAKISPEKKPLPYDRWELGTQYTNISLPVLSNRCTGIVCRKNLSALGATFGYNLTRYLALDSTVNIIPGQQGTQPMTEGLFGVKIGERFKKWAVFGKIRPGFIYYQSAMPGSVIYTPDSLTRFAWDLGGIVEVYPSRASTWRFDVGSTLVRYLSDHTDPRMSPFNDLRSTQYIVNQGNLQVATTYLYRF